VAVEAVTAIAASAAGVPVVLSLPAPARWPAIMAAQAGQEAAPPDPDRAETAAMYAADFLRIFAGSGVDGLVLDEGPTLADDLIHADAYRSVLNVADHYGGPVLIRTGTAPAWPYGEVAGVCAWLGAAGPGQPAGRWGVVVGADFWNGADPTAEASLALASVPADADPDAVMQRVRALA